MKLHSHFARLLENTVNINQHRLGQLQAHATALTECLQDDAALGPRVQSIIRQGSWAHRTIIKPPAGIEFDADLLVKMRQHRPWAQDPAQYLTALHEALSRNARYKNRIELKTRCIRVSYANECHVDLVPYIHRHGWFDEHLIVNRRKNEFEHVNPAEFAKWVTDRDHVAKGHLRTTIRLLKHQRDHMNSFMIPSVILTVLIGARVNAWSSFWGSYIDLPTTFVTLVNASDKWLQERPKLPAIPDPSCVGVRFDHRLNERSYSEFRSRFNNFAEKVRVAYSSDDHHESAALWGNVFGDKFAPTS